MSHSFFPWMGGKTKQAAQIVKLIPEHTCYVEVFGGAANILFAKPRSKTEVLNDINADLVTLFRVVKYHRREFLRQLQFVTHSRREFDDFKAQRGLTDCQKAARFYLILKAAFGGKGGTGDCHFGYGTTGRARYSRLTFAAIHRCHRRLDGVILENIDFADCLRRYDRPHTFFYCDPPYLETHGYASEFGLEHHKQLAAILQQVKGKFLLSINDHPVIRRLYKGCRIVPVKTFYTISRDKAAAAQDRGELLIANYKI
ncbi:MAG: DNA adenine methylase [Planctomycetaceae bacterium]|nr:DNA adenine methylase [Planctomycetaceae bacterium]